MLLFYMCAQFSDLFFGGACMVKIKWHTSYMYMYCMMNLWMEINAYSENPYDNLI